jgi:hypothetical protein
MEERHMLIDCDTCTVRGHGCSDCVVTVLLGAPPGEHSHPVVLSLMPRTRGQLAETATTDEDAVLPPAGVVVDFDEVERRAVRALADGGLVPPLRHRDATGHGPDGSVPGSRRTG